MNYTVGIIAAFLTLLCWTIGTFAFTAATSLADPLRINRVRLLYAAAALFVFSLIVTGAGVSGLVFSPGLMQWFWLGLSGIIGLTIGDYFAFTAYSLIGGSRASMFNVFAPLTAFCFGMLMLGEHVNAAGLFGMSVSVSGILWFVVVSRLNRNAELSRKDLLKGMLFAALGSVSQGAGLVCAKKGMTMPGGFSMHPVHASWMRMSAAMLATYFIGAFRTNLVSEFKSVTFNRPLLKHVLTGTLFGPVLGASFSLAAAKNLEVSLAQTIFSLLPISVLLFAVVSGRERVQRQSFLAAIISIAGVIMLVWRNELQNIFR